VCLHAILHVFTYSEYEKFQTSISVKQVDSVITLNFKLLTKYAADPSVRAV